VKLSDENVLKGVALEGYYACVILDIAHCPLFFVHRPLSNVSAAVDNASTILAEAPSD
jgi:hypothetical protein